MKSLFLKTLLLPAALLLHVLLHAQKSVLTQHNDLNRTGWYDNETSLNKDNVRQGSFGKIFVRSVDDQIYAQPLVKTNLTLPTVGKKNIVFVATVNNTVYAFDADSANVNTAYWKVNLTADHSRVISKFDETGACGGSYNDFSGNMGIVGTPVIDSTTNTLYVVARSIDTTGGGNNAIQYLHALDLATGAEKANSPMLITASVSGTGDGSSGGSVSFNPLHQNQRSGLLLLNGVVYIAWASHCDWGPYHGWLMGYDKTTLQQKYVYNSTPDGYNGGIWMSGGGPSADSNGNIYLAVGNGTVGNNNGDAADPRNRSESALKLSPSGNGFTLQSFFTPKNYLTLEGADLDFGVTQVMLIPGTNRAIVGVKDGHLYLLDRTNMGGYSSVTDNVAQTINLGSNSFLRSSLSYFNGSKKYIFSWSENSLLRAYPYNTTTNLIDLNNEVTSGLPGPVGNNGAVLSVSSNGSIDSTGILWASYAANGDANQSVRPGILRAIDATDVTKELWNSSVNPNDNPGNYAKFNCPTIANGKVYLATFSNQLVVYGLTGGSPDTCNSANIALNRPVYASSLESADYAASNATDGNINTRWSSQFADPQYIYVDLGARYDLCRVILHWETALGKDFKIQVSDDASSWTDVLTITNNTSYDNYLSLKGTGRYVRLSGTQRGTIYGYSLWEFEVYGKRAATCLPPSNLNSSDLYQTSVTLHWTGTSSNYVVQYKTVTATDWTPAIATSNSITLNNLSCNAPYLYRVQGVCGVADSSNYSAQGGFTTLPCNINCDPLPTRWSTQDVGNTGVAGSACYNSSTATFELKGSGTDIGGTADAFRFAFKTVVGDGEIIARVVDQDNVNGNDKCGIMMRESLAEGSKFAFVCLRNSNAVFFESRSATDGATRTQSVSGAKPPSWLKLIVVGSTFTAYMSADGYTWKQIGTSVDANFGNGSPVYAGLAITSHDNTTLSIAHVDNFMATGLSELKLISFTGSLLLDQTVALDWTTTLETKTNYFVVERTKDNMYYQPVDTVYAMNNGDYTQNYDAVDLSPYKGMNYYRLKIVGLDGSITYSPIVAVRVTNEKAPLLFPNPANTFVNIARGTEEIKYINVYNIIGSAVLRIPDASSQAIVQIPTHTLPGGMYIIEIRTTSTVYRQKLIVHN